MGAVSVLLAAHARAQEAPATSYDHLLYGEQQLSAMLSDRPSMAVGLMDGSPLRTWAVVQFSGQSTGFRVQWDAGLPVTGASSEHELPKPGLPAIIRIHPRYVRDGRPQLTKGFADAWAELIFELHNVQQHGTFEAIHRALMAGTLSRSQWLEQMSRTEHRALLETASFYRSHWRQWLGRQGRGLRWYQILAVEIDFGTWLARRSGYPEWPYGTWFDETMQPYLEAQRLEYRYNPFIPSLVVD